jgi:hypothetical protein
MAANRGFGDLIYEIRTPVLLAMAWAILGIATSTVITGDIADTVWLSVRVALTATAGYVATRRRFGLWTAVAAGAIVYFADHVLVKGIWFLVTDDLLAAAGVLVSFVMFVWVPAIIGFLGGLLGKVRPSDENAAI